MFHFLSIIDENSISKAEPLKKSIERFGYQLTLITTYDKSIGNHSKIVKVSEYLQNQKYDDDDYIFLIDAFDCIMTDHPNKVIHYMYDYSIDILISTERGYGNKPDEAKSYFNLYLRRLRKLERGLCAGALVAKANKLKEFMLDMTNSISEFSDEIKSNWNQRHDKPMPKKFIYSDQYFMAFYLWKIDFINYKKISIHLDVFDKGFFTWHYEKKFEPKDYVFVHVFALRWEEQSKRWKELLEKCDLIQYKLD